MATIVGTNSANTPLGASYDDLIYGNDGDDVISGDPHPHGIPPFSLGNDNIYGGSGYDTIRGADGQDYLSGGTGDDFISGQ